MTTCVVQWKMMKPDFPVWFSEQLQERGWSRREMARRLGVSHSSIAYLAKGEMKPSVRMCKKIASAFLVPNQEVMARVGMLDPIPPETASRREADFLFSRLSDEEQEIVLAQMRALVERRRARADSQTA